MEFGQITEKLGELFRSEPAVPRLKRATSAERKAARKHLEELDRQEGQSAASEQPDAAQEDAETTRHSFSVSNLGQSAVSGFRTVWNFQGRPVTAGRGLQREYERQLGVTGFAEE